MKKPFVPGDVRFPMGVHVGRLHSTGLNPQFRCKRCKVDRPILGRKQRKINGRAAGFICKQCSDGVSHA